MEVPGLEQPVHCVRVTRRSCVGRITWVAVLLAVCVLVRVGYSAPGDIRVFSSQYTIGLSFLAFDPATNYSTTIVSELPVAGTVSQPGTGIVEASAAAAPFSVSTYTGIGPWTEDWRLNNCWASAKSELSFSPVATGEAAIGLQFQGWYQWYYSGGSVTLLDETLNQELWSYYWDGMAGGSVPWVFAPGADPAAAASLVVPTELLAADTYRLTLYAWTDSNPADREQILIQLSGLEPIPEPSAAALLTFAAALWVGRRKSLRQQVGPAPPYPR